MIKIAGDEIRTLETKEQWDWFNNFKHDEKQAGFRNFSFSGDNGPPSFFSVATKLSFHGYELIEADGEIWPVKPDENFKEIFGLNPVKSGPTHRHLAQEEYEEYINNVVCNRLTLMLAPQLRRMGGFIYHEGKGEMFNKPSIKDKQGYICELPKPYDEVGDGGVSYIGGTSGSSTENMNYGCGEVRGHPDQNHSRKNHFASDDEGNRFGEAAMKQNIDNKKVNDEHVVDMPEGADHSDKKEQANDGLFGLCKIGLANTVSLMGSNPPPWATTPTSQRLFGFSGVANAVGYVGTTAALSLRYTKPGAARIFANIGPIGCAWGVIMGFTSYLPGEFQWLGYVAAVFCTLAVLLANY